MHLRLPLALLLVLTAGPAWGQQVRWDSVHLRVGEAQVRPEPALPQAPDPVPPPPWSQEGDRVADHLELEDHRLLLVLRGGPDRPGPFGDEPGSWVLFGGPADAEEPAWSLDLPQRGGLKADGAFLLGARGPHAAYGGARPLTAVRVWNRTWALVLAGERGDLLKVDPASGKVEARLEAPWEIERGFVGPSVWSAMLTRFGQDLPLFVEDPKVEEKRQAFEQRCRGWILGGPVVSGPSVFLAVAYATPGPWVRQRAAARLLELDHGLRPKAMLDLPAPIEPRAVAATAGGTLWTTAEGSLLRVEPTEALLGQMGPGGPSGRCDLRWVTSFDPIEDEGVFLHTGTAGRLIAVDGDRILTAFHGGRVLDAERGSIRLPLDVSSARTGRGRRVEVVVPLTEEVAAPSTNYRSRGTTYTVFGPRYAGIVGLTVTADLFVVSLASGAESKAFAFPLNVLD